MNTAEIIQEIKGLPVETRLRIVEQTLRSIRETESRQQLEKAAEMLAADYGLGKELIVFTALDFNDFYEVR